MNKNLHKLAGIAFLLGGAAFTSAHAQILTNGNFETNYTGKVVGFDNASNDVPGWKDAGTIIDDSGVDNNGHNEATLSDGGLATAYIEGTDSGAYQLTSTKVAAGDTLTLTWEAINTYAGGGQDISIIDSSSSSAAFGSTTTLASDIVTSNLSTNWTSYTLSYVVTAADAGNYIGVAFSNPNGKGSYAAVDNFVLTDVAATPTPEPSTYALLFGGLGFLFLFHRFRFSKV